MKNKHLVRLPLVAVLGAGAARAEEAGPYQLTPNLVVTPSRITETLGEALAPVSVITRDDIEISAAEDLFELLRLQPGVDIVRSGGAGSQTSVFLRGSNSNHVLVLIDGVRVSSANTGAYVWEHLPLNQVERIEIVRGPRGSLYGSDSIGGVIHVITRSDTNPYARLTGGSFGTWELEGGLGYSGDHTQISMNAGYRHSDGFSSQNPQGFSYHPDDDGYENVNLGIKGSTQTGQGRWQYSLLGLEGETEFDQGISKTEQWIGSIGFHGQFNPDWDYQLLGGYISDRLNSDFGFFSSGFKSKRYQLSWQNQWQSAAGGRLNFGLDYYRETGSSLYAWDERRNNVGLFASFDRRFDRLLLQASGRFDENSRFGGKFTGQFAFGYDLGASWQITGSYGSAFRGPNLSEQFSPGFGGLFAGNPDLDPESSTSGDAGLRWTGEAAGSFSASLYRTDVSDLISFSGENYQALNIDEARLEGLEIVYGLSRGNWDFNANATLQRTENRATGEPLPRRPEEKGSLSVTRHFSNQSWVGFEWFYSGPREDFGGVTLGSYHLVNFRSGWVLAPSWRIELRAENLADEAYEPAYGFNSAGRSWFLSLAWIP
jgi:vitamin B12 transporter